MVTPKEDKKETTAKRPQRACAKKRKLDVDGEAPANGQEPAAQEQERAPAKDEPVRKKRRSKYSAMPSDERLEMIRLGNCDRTERSRRKQLGEVVNERDELVDEFNGR